MLKNLFVRDMMYNLDLNNGPKSLIYLTGLLMTS